MHLDPRHVVADRGPGTRAIESRAERNRVGPRDVVENVAVHVTVRRGERANGSSELLLEIARAALDLVTAHRRRHTRQIGVRDAVPAELDARRRELAHSRPIEQLPRRTVGATPILAKVELSRRHEDHRRESPVAKHRMRRGGEVGEAVVERDQHAPGGIDRAAAMPVQELLGTSSP